MRNPEVRDGVIHAVQQDLIAAPDAAGHPKVDRGDGVENTGKSAWQKKAKSSRGYAILWTGCLSPARA
jgi:hypothetical protein